MGQVIKFTRNAKVSAGGVASNISLRPLAAFYADHNGQFDYVNSEWCKLGQCSQSAAFGHGWLNLIHADDRTQVAEYWRNAVKDEKFFSIEFRLATPGMARVLFQALPQYDERGHHLGYCGTLTPLPTSRQPVQVESPSAVSRRYAENSEATAAETRIREDRLRQAIDLAGLYYFEHDLIANTTYRSTPLRNLFRGNRALTELAAALHPEDAPKFWENHNRCLASKVPCANEYRLTFPGCEHMHVKSLALFSYDKIGRVTAIFGFTLPISKWTTGWSSSAAEILHNISNLIF